MRIAKVLNPILASVPWAARCIVQEDSLVYAVPATNQPEDSRIKWWLFPISCAEPWAMHAFGYGVAAYEEDIEVVSFDYEAPSLEELEEKVYAYQERR